MIILKKDKNGIVTGAHVLRFTALHIFFIVQVAIILIGIISGNTNMDVLLLPTLMVSGILAILLLIGNIANGLLGIIKVFRHEKTTVAQFLWAIIVIAQVLALVLPLFGVQNLGGLAIMKFFYAIHIVMAAIAFAIFTVIEVISDICLLLKLNKIGFALKDLYKLPLKAAEAKLEKSNEKEEA